MISRLIPLVLFISCAATSGAQAIGANPTLAENPARHGWSAHLAFELTTPTGSQGRWSTGGGATFTIAYTYYLTSRWFISPGLGGFYNTMGTDFIPEYGTLYEGTIKNFGVRVPVYSGYNFKLPGDFELAVATGPAININVYAREHASPNFSAEVIEPDKPVNLFGRGFNHVDLQWSFFASLTYREHYCVGISAAFGLTNVATITDGPCTLHVHRNNVALLLSYKF